MSGLTLEGISRTAVISVMVQVTSAPRRIHRCSKQRPGRSPEKVIKPCCCIVAVFFVFCVARLRQATSRLSTNMDKNGEMGIWTSRLSTDHVASGASSLAELTVLAGAQSEARWTRNVSKNTEQCNLIGPALWENVQLHPQDPARPTVRLSSGFVLVLQCIHSLLKHKLGPANTCQASHLVDAQVCEEVSAGQRLRFKRATIYELYSTPQCSLAKKGGSAQLLPFLVLNFYR
jgi:hypothetical protein